MKSTNDNPVDPLGTLRQVIRPTKPAQPDPIRSFEQQRDIASQEAAMEAILETLRRKQWERDEQADD